MNHAPPPPRHDAAVRDYGLEEQVRFFERNRVQALAGLTFSVPVMIGLIWPRVDDHGLLLWWGAAHFVTALITALAFYLPFRSPEQLTRFPRAATVAVCASLTAASTTIFVVADFVDDLAVVLGIAAVLFSVAAGAAITIGPLAPMSRPALASTIVPFAIGSLVFGYWVLGLACLFFVGVVALRGIGATIEWFDELTRLRAESAENAKQAEMASRTDLLTGLANRTGLVEETDRPYDATVMALFIDLDGFKQVNDSLGHLAGDEVLAVCAARLNGETRDEDCVARLGGDEFFVVVDSMTESEVTDLSERIIAAISQPIVVASAITRVSASIGIATVAGDEFDLDDLMNRADAALYEAKRLGRNRVAYAEPPSS